MTVLDMQAFLAHQQTAQSRLLASLNPRINLLEAERLLSDYHSGLLAKHDNTLGKPRHRRAGCGSSLMLVVEAWEVERVLRLMDMLRARPGQDLPLRQGWWVHVLDYYFWLTYPDTRKRFKHADPENNADLPIPTDHQIGTAWVIFCNLLYQHVIKDRHSHGQKARSARQAQTA